MKNKTFNVALVGCGTIAPNHLNALSGLEGVRITALCDVKRERAEKLNEEFSLNAKIYTDYKELLLSEELDAVHIATPHYLHAEMTILALRSGVNVFLEKPMCITEREITSLIEEEKKSTASVCVCFQNRFVSATKKALEITEQDGGAITAHFSVFWQRDEKYYTESGWRGKMATEGGGVMINQAIHSLDLLSLFLGKPERIVATTANHHLKGVIDVEDSCEGMIEFDSGKSANFYATTSALYGDDTQICIKTRNHRILLNFPNITVDGKTISYEDENHYVGKICYGNGHAVVIAMFYDALRCNKPMPVSLESAQYSIRTILAAYKSHDKETII